MRPIGTALAALLITSLLTYLVTWLAVPHIRLLGFPVAFWESWQPCPDGKECSTLHIIRLAIDLAFWLGASYWFSARRGRAKASS